MNCVGLAWSCLTVGKNADVVAIDGILNKSFCLLKDLLLSWVRSKNAVEVISVIDPAMHSATKRIVNRYAHLRFLSVFKLIGSVGPDPAVNSDFALDIL